ncbi:MAG: methylated-DNA--[protein]-cysteine S-methyltransferase [candidate division Zixibacteria bacterium]|nr:methylated-DNA--[protein]-cysteine S-methyltransferase [candidate division Zixibacteria bacterium]
MSSPIYSLFFNEFSTAWGTFRLAAGSAGVVAVGLAAADGNTFFNFLKRRYPGFLFLERATAELEQGRAEIEEYLAGVRREFGVPFQIRVTPFQLKVLEAVSTIPYGSTATYGDIARRVGLPDGARAVGAACAANPIPLIVPCHRVVGASGLGGFRDGVALKRKLLQHEGVRLK